MTPRKLFLTGTLGAAMALAGCGSDSGDTTPIGYDPATAQMDPAADAATGSGTESTADAENSYVDPKAMLRSVVQLLRSAATNPGGDNFNIARDYLNQYFAGAKPAEFKLADSTRAYLGQKLGPKAESGMADLETPTFTFRDSRHIEDCLLISTVARRVAGDGDDLTRVRRIFDWMIGQVQLVPNGALGTANLPQAAARPYDVLIRAMATEEGAWTERSWLFASLCRQIGIDTGFVRMKSPAPPATDSAGETPQPRAFIWAVAALVETTPGHKTPYLFDCRLGMPIPGPDGKDVSTLEQAATDPAVLARLDLPDQPYPVHQADLAAEGKWTIWLDSTLGFLSPRMRQLQRDLSGRDRMVLFRDPAEVDAAFAQALGPHFGSTEFWALPIEVETRLFTDPTFNEATKYSLKFFDPRLPLQPARMGQLRGDLADAVRSYAAIRYADHPVMNDGKTPIPEMIQHVIDFYATYYLALAKLDQGEPARAADFFQQTLVQIEDFEKELPQLPAEQRTEPYFAQYRWGALTNLGRIEEASGHREAAIQYYSVPQPTGQGHGNRLRAQTLLWTSPFATDPTAPR